MEPYIRFTARGDLQQVAAIAATRGIPFEFVTEVRVGDFVETVGKVALTYQRAMAAWFKESLDLLAYAVTTDAREIERQAERQERVAEARRVIDERDRLRRAEERAAKLAAIEIAD